MSIAKNLILDDVNFDNLAEVVAFLDDIMSEGIRRGKAESKELQAFAGNIRHHWGASCSVYPLKNLGVRAFNADDRAAELNRLIQGDSANCATPGQRQSMLDGEA